MLALFVRGMIRYLKQVTANRKAGLYANAKYKKRIRKLNMLFFGMAFLQFLVLAVGVLSRASLLVWEIIGIANALLLITLGIVSVIRMRLLLKGIE